MNAPKEYRRWISRVRRRHGKKNGCIPCGCLDAPTMERKPDSSKAGRRAIKRLRASAISCAALAMLAGCATQERIVTKEVKVPVPVKAEAPDWLMAGYKPEAIPEFVAPDDPRASSALTPEGEKALRLIIIDLTGRDDAWREWAR